MADNKLTEQSAIAAEGIKQLVEQGRKTLAVTEQVAGLLTRLGSASSPAARAFDEAAIVSSTARRQSPAARVFAEAASELRASSTRGQSSSVQQTVEAGISQVQEAAQPRADRDPARLRHPPSFESIHAAMMQAIAQGRDPVQAARNPTPVPLGPNQWPKGMPALPTGTPQDANPANIPQAPGASGGGLGGVLGSLLRIAGTAGTAGAAISNQFYGGFSAGHGMEQFLRESQTQSDFQTSLLTRLRVAGDIVSTAANALPAVGHGLWQHFFESGKTSVGDGPK